MHENTFCVYLQICTDYCIHVCFMILCIKLFLSYLYIVRARTHACFCFLLCCFSILLNLNEIWTVKIITYIHMYYLPISIWTPVRKPICMILIYFTLSIVTRVVGKNHCHQWKARYHLVQTYQILKKVQSSCTTERADSWGTYVVSLITRNLTAAHVLQKWHVNNDCWNISRVGWPTKEGDKYL